MKELIAMALWMTPVGILAAGSVYMACKGIDGWGWMLFVCFLIMGSTNIDIK